MNETLKKIQAEIDEFKENNPDVNLDDINDGDHSFLDLYNHRTDLLALAVRCFPYSWKSRKHEDGSMFDGMFIVGAPTPYGMITYHCRNEFWNLFKIPEIPHATHFDGHTPDDVLDRIESTIENSAYHIVNDRTKPIFEKILVDEILPTFGDDAIGKASFISFYRC